MTVKCYFAAIHDRTETVGGKSKNKKRDEDGIFFISFLKKNDIFNAETLELLPKV